MCRGRHRDLQVIVEGCNNRWLLKAVSLCTNDETAADGFNVLSNCCLSLQDADFEELEREMQRHRQRGKLGGRDASDGRRGRGGGRRDRRQRDELDPMDPASYSEVPR